MPITASNANVVLRMHSAPEQTAGGILLPERARLGRIGTVVSAGPESVLAPGDVVVRSAFDGEWVEDLLIVNEGWIYCLLQGSRLWAFAGRLILLLDPLEERELSIPESVREKQYFSGSRCPLRKATVLSSGFDEYPDGGRVLVAPDVYDCLQVLPHDKDLPFADVPTGQEVRIYKPDLRTVTAQVPILLSSG